MEFVVFDGCVIPKGLLEELTTIKAKTPGAVLVSGYRGKDAEPLLKRLGKSSQTQLWNGFIRGLPGFNPANPPGRSTHECYNDGVAYPGPAGIRLPYWCCGMDWDIPHVQAVTRTAASLGFHATVTYPTSSRERQHVNFRKEPKIKLFKAIKPGQRDPRVPKLKRQLAYVHDPDNNKAYLPAAFDKARGRKHWRAGDEFVKALKAFQRDHGQHPDGIYGPQTAKQLAASVRFRTSRLKARKK